MTNAPNKELRQLAKEIRPHGWYWERTKGNHLKWRGPEGQMVTTGSSSSDVRALRNIRSELRKQGCPINISARQSPATPFVG